jgi:hypothetical protein
VSFYRALLGRVWLAEGLLVRSSGPNRLPGSLKVSVCGGSQTSWVDAGIVKKFKGEVMRDLECELQ